MPYICFGQRISEGNGNVPFSFIAMASETQIQVITGMLQELLQPDPDCFLVDIWIKPTNNIRVALDADNGLAIEKCVSINRRLYKQIEEAALYPDGNFSLEVSSPGLDEPLKMHRQYIKNISRPVEVLLQDGGSVAGVLTAVNESGIEIAETIGKNKKKEVVQHNIPFINIKSTKIQIKF
ncbi:MAG: ribosome maturation factor [Bacteroidota bacterium]